MSEHLKWQRPVVIAWLYIVTAVCSVIVICVLIVNWALGISAGAALFGIAQPGFETARNAGKLDKSYKDLTPSERKAMWIRITGMIVTMVGFVVGGRACG